MFEKVGGRGEYSRTEPQKFPAFSATRSVTIVSQLFDDLTVRLISHQVLGLRIKVNVKVKKYHDRTKLVF